MIRTENLTRHYGHFTAVDQVSFGIGKGEIVGLLGHNGAGKTTIMKMLTGFLEPSSGDVWIDGCRVSDHRAVTQSKIGYLPENCPVYPEMTVIDYLEYAAALRGMAESESLGAVRQAIERTELMEKATDSIGTLSRGYRQRVGVAQAILPNPEILILDEPTNGLDPAQIQHMRGLITELAKHSTVILSTHILQEVEAICDRVLIIRNGRLALDSRLDQLHQGSALEVSINKGPEQAGGELAQLNGVQSVRFVGQDGPGYRFVLEVDCGPEQTVIEHVPPVARALVDSGLDLYRIAPEVRDLETVFREINEAAV